MKLKLNKKVFKNIEPGENALSLFTLAVFLGVSWLILSKVEVLSSEIPNYNKLVENPYTNIENLIQKNRLREVVETEQFKDLMYRDNLTKEYEKEEKGNLFEKKF